MHAKAGNICAILVIGYSRFDSASNSEGGGHWTSAEQATLRHSAGIGARAARDVPSSRRRG